MSDTVDITECSITDYVKEHLGSVDKVFLTVGFESIVDDAFEIISKKGKIISIAIFEGKTGVDLNKVFGKVELLPNSEGKLYSDLLKTGNFNISPYGYGEKDENGNIKNFDLVGFSVSPKINKLKENTMNIKEDNIDIKSLISDDTIDPMSMLEYFLERFKQILLFSISNNSINQLKRLFDCIIKVKEVQLIKNHEKDIETNP